MGRGEAAGERTADLAKETLRSLRFPSVCWNLSLVGFIEESVAKTSTDPEMVHGSCTRVLLSRECANSRPSAALGCPTSEPALSFSATVCGRTETTLLHVPVPEPTCKFLGFRGRENLKGKEMCRGAEIPRTWPARGMDQETPAPAQKREEMRFRAGFRVRALNAPHLSSLVEQKRWDW